MIKPAGQIRAGEKCVNGLYNYFGIRNAYGKGSIGFGLPGRNLKIKYRMSPDTQL